MVSEVSYAYHYCHPTAVASGCAFGLSSAMVLVRAAPPRPQLPLVVLLLQCANVFAAVLLGRCTLLRSNF